MQDLDAYLRRIGYSGDRAPSLDTLNAIHYLHTQAIAFENLNPFLGRPVPLDPASLRRKLVDGGRGGYCFEQNLLLREILRQLGFDVVGLMARVRWGVEPGAIRQRSHMLLLVRIDGAPFLADVGFGGQTLTAPLRLETDIEQTTPHNRFRLLREGECFVMQAEVEDIWKSLYSFDLQPQLPVDYEAINWYLSSHPDSHFVKGLMVARPGPDCRYALQNGQFSVHRPGGAERRTITAAAELRAVLEDVFLISTDALPELEGRLARLLV